MSQIYFYRKKSIVLDLQFNMETSNNTSNVVWGYLIFSRYSCTSASSFLVLFFKLSYHILKIVTGQASFNEHVAHLGTRTYDAVKFSFPFYRNLRLW
jgi:hypothetical protein